jgi:MATE family multidrug resistance protein
MLLLAILYLGFPRTLIALDINIYAPEHREIVRLAILFLSAAAILQVIDTVRLLSFAALRGLKDTKVPLWVSVIGFWFIACPCAYLFGFAWHLGGIGLWLGLIVGLSTAGATLFIRFQKLSNSLDLQALVTRSDVG